MKLLIDDANLEKIESLYEYYPIDGVTTNPTILSKYDDKASNILKEIRRIIGDNQELHVQILSEKAEDIVKEAYKIREMLGENTYVKIPSYKEGFKAMKQLHAEGVNITATAIYSPMQTYLAGKAGADYVAPYINRIDNLGYDGLHIVEVIDDILINNGFETEILAASFKNVNQVLKLATLGVGAATCPPDVIEKFVDDNNISLAINTFKDDFEKRSGAGTTMLNIFDL